MNTWIAEEWFKELVSEMREAISDAQLAIDEPACRMQCDYWLERNMRVKEQAEPLANREFVIQVAMAMTEARLQRRGFGDFQGLYQQLPSMKRVEKALSAPIIYEKIKIGGTPPDRMQDDRIEAGEFARVLKKQVFDRQVD